MNTRLLLVPLFAALLASGCAKNGAPAADAAASTAPAASSATKPGAGPRVIEITANDQMKFSVTTIEAKAGEELKVVLTNAGTLPKEAMGHNWVLLKAGSDSMAFSTATASAKDTDYIPAALKDQIVAFVPLLGPRKSGEVVFTVPAPGVYPFLCSFPAHYAIGMKGTLIVK